jgi:hypothetical protein
MTPRDHFRQIMAERRSFARHTPEHDWRTRAARKYLWIIRDVPPMLWGNMENAA